MRYPASDKIEIIRTFEGSHLSTKQVKAFSLARLRDLADCYPVLRALISNM